MSKRMLNIVAISVAMTLAAGHAWAVPASASGQKAAAGKLAAKAAGPRSLDWLGPLPPKLDKEKVMETYEGVFQRVMDDVQSGGAGPNGRPGAFTCLKPEELGPVPLMGDLQAYLDAFPKGRHDPALVDGLYRAAAAGNWLARSWLLDFLADQAGSGRLDEDEKIVLNYRFVQLASWLQEHRHGSVHATIGALYWPRQPGVGLVRVPTNDIYAARHGAYVSQLRLGSDMLDNAQGTETEAKAMIACALSVSQAYGYLATGFFGADAEQ